MHGNRFSTPLMSGVIVGFTAFMAGFVLPVLWDPTTAQGPMLGIFITGPTGFILGLILGGISKRSAVDEEGRPRGFAAVWRRVLQVCIVSSVLLILAVLLIIPAREARYSPIVADSAEFLKKDKGLEELRVRALADKDLLLLREFTRLKRLDFHSGWAKPARLTDAGLAIIADTVMATLQHLDLGKCAGITDAGLDHVARLKLLRYLSLRDCVGITDQGIAKLMDLPGLLQLDLRECHKITNTGIQILVRLKNLKKLRLGGCRGINRQDVIELSKKMPTCQISYGN